MKNGRTRFLKPCIVGVMLACTFLVLLAGFKLIRLHLPIDIYDIVLWGNLVLVILLTSESKRKNNQK